MKSTLLVSLVALFAVGCDEESPPVPTPYYEAPPQEEETTSEPIVGPEQINGTADNVSIPVAVPVPGKEGYVFSPHNKRVVDVGGIPLGTLVQDPGYPAQEKRYFRVP